METPQGRAKTEASLPVEIINKYSSSAPVDVEALARELGIRLIAQPLFGDTSGMIECEDGGPCTITVNAEHGRNRRRFTIAHEIAHFVLHRDLIGDGVTDSGLYRSGLSDDVERQANKYAAEILMPWRLVVARYHEGVNTPEKMAKAFLVSPAVAEIRLRELKWLF